MQFLNNCDHSKNVKAFRKRIVQPVELEAAAHYPRYSCWDLETYRCSVWCCSWFSFAFFKNKKIMSVWTRTLIYRSRRLTFSLFRQYSYVVRFTMRVVCLLYGDAKIEETMYCLIMQSFYFFCHFGIFLGCVLCKYFRMKGKEVIITKISFLAHNVKHKQGNWELIIFDPICGCDTK